MSWRRRNRELLAPPLWHFHRVIAGRREDELPAEGEGGGGGNGNWALIGACVTCRIICTALLLWHLRKLHCLLLLLLLLSAAAAAAAATDSDTAVAMFISAAAAAFIVGAFTLFAVSTAADTAVAAAVIHLLFTVPSGGGSPHVIEVRSVDWLCRENGPRHHTDRQLAIIRIDYTRKYARLHIFFKKFRYELVRERRALVARRGFEVRVALVCRADGRVFDPNRDRARYVGLNFYVKRISCKRFFLFFFFGGGVRDKIRLLFFDVAGSCSTSARGRRWPRAPGGRQKSSKLSFPSI